MYVHSKGESLSHIAQFSGNEISSMTLIILDYNPRLLKSGNESQTIVLYMQYPESTQG